MKKLLYLYLILLLIPICLLFVTAKDEQHHIIVILGTKLEEDGNIGPLLQNRLDTALLVGQTETTYIVSGKGEALAMKEYLLAEGILPAQIVVESQATNTYENLMYTAALLPTDTTHFTIISSDFHLYRAQAIAEDLGLDTNVISASTPFVDRFYWQFRESIALFQFWTLRLFN